MSLKARPTPRSPGPRVRPPLLWPWPSRHCSGPDRVSAPGGNASPRWLLACALAVSCLFLVACGGSGSNEGQGGAPPPQPGASQVDFEVTAIAASPGALRTQDVLTVTATIQNTGTEPSGNFLVRSFLKRGTNCDGATYPIGTQTLSIPAGGSASFQAAGNMNRVRDLGTHYVCLVLDALEEIEELDETNNTVGGTSTVVEIVLCVDDAQCEDENLCTEDRCEPLLGCQYTANTLPCDDGLFCTVGDVCGGGRCQGAAARSCTDPDLCDGTMYCDEIADACVNGEAPAPCDDGNRCNGTETCNPVDGSCQAGTPIACDLLLNNGAGPPSSSNVISNTTYDEHSDEVVRVRDLGCPLFGDADSFCPVGAAATTLEVTGNARVGDLRVFDESLLTLTGGRVVDLSGGQFAYHDLAGGEVERAETLSTTIVSGGDHRYLALHGEASIEGGRIDDLELDARVVGAEGVVRGGEVAIVHASTGSSIAGGRVSLLCARDDPGVIYGRDFDVSGGAYGPVPGSQVFLRGVLESGERFDTTVLQQGAPCVHPIEGAYETAGSFMLLPPRSTFIANGLAPEAGDPDNVLDAADPATLHHDVYVRDVGCPSNWPSAFADDPCFEPGAKTELVVEAGANLPGSLYARDDSEVIVRGGAVSNLRVAAGAVIEVWGDGFAVDGVPVPFGNLIAADGVLTGTLAAGDPLVAQFDRLDLHTPAVYGRIELRPVSDLPPGTSVVGTLFGGLGEIGGVEVELDIETGGYLFGDYRLLALEEISQAVPDFLGLAFAANGFQDQYQIWELDFTGSLLDPGTSVVRFAYDPALVAPGEFLILFAWNGFEWVRVEEGVVIDALNHTIEIPISGFTTFALIIRDYLVPALSLFGVAALVAGLLMTGSLASRRATREAVR